MLAEKGHHISDTPVLKCRRELGWTRRGSAYCQMIRDVNKEKRLELARNNVGDDFADCIYSDETMVQIATHRRFCCTKTGLKPRHKPRPKHPTKVHVWAAISKKGKSGICIFEGCMDAVGYVSILEQTLLPILESCIQMDVDSFRTTIQNTHPLVHNNSSMIKGLTGGVRHLNHLIVTQ